MAGESTINPYEPPASDVDAPDVPASALAEGAFVQPLFSPKQMLAAAIVGSVVAGVLLLQANYRAMGRASAANKTLLVGALASAALFALFAILPDGIPGTPVAIVVGLTFYKLADSMQGPAVFEHLRAGGDRQSNWLVFGISAGTLIAILVVAFLIARASGV